MDHQQINRATKIEHNTRRAIKLNLENRGKKYELAAHNTGTFFSNPVTEMLQSTLI